MLECLPHTRKAPGLISTTAPERRKEAASKITSQSLSLWGLGAVQHHCLVTVVCLQLLMQLIVGSLAGAGPLTFQLCTMSEGAPLLHGQRQRGKTFSPKPQEALNN